MDRKIVLAPVSAIIPCYRCTETIERAFNSVVNQTRPPRQIILVDDASNDGTLGILKKLKSTHEGIDINLIELKKNVGPGKARNLAWEIASQPYITFLDSDDAWHPKKIEIQLEAMEHNPDLLIIGHQFHTRSAEIAETEAMGWAAKIRFLSRREILFSNKFPTPTVMIRADVPHRFDIEKRYSEDYFLWLLVCLSKPRSAAIILLPLVDLFKPIFGAKTGLSSKLWRIEKGELENYRFLRKQGLISPHEWILYSFTSLLKYFRRCLISRRFN